VSATIFPITMPKWGIEMTEGTINSWSAAEGARIEKGAPLLEVETEKIVNAVESPVSGTLRRILAAQGEVRAVGSLIAVCADPAIPDSDIDRFVADFKGAVVSFEPDGGAAQVASSAPAAPEATGDGDARVSPIARRIAERLGVDLSKVTGTGRNGRISKEDVEAFAARSGGPAAPGTAPPASAPAFPTAAPATNNPVARAPMSPMRATIARRLLEASQSIPAYRLAIDVHLAALLAARARHASGSAEPPSVTDLLVHAVASVLVQHPVVNAQLDGNDILQFTDADIALAVATDNGLITPIVRQANRKSTADIARETRDLLTRARAGALKRDEITGGTFTISNLGMFGISRFDAIINPPQVAILAVGAAEDRVVWRDGAAVGARMMTLTLTADHRVVDGAVGARFLSALKQAIEQTN
jgi:pyruvate dehydrogenase E2 component (dihydrolipoamide acetyltransferase)